MPVLTAKTPTKTYPVWIEAGILDRLGTVLAPLCPGRTIALVTDDQVAPLYLQQAIQALEKASFTVSHRVLPAGEQSKTRDQLDGLYTFFHQAGLTRIDPVVALGGGVVGDLAGFAAATWLRGVPLVQVPTSLLAQVDASIGGKTAIDIPLGKNLIGSIYQPTAVIMDPLCLKSLPDRRLAEGMAEVIKYGLIDDASLLDLLEEPVVDLAPLIQRCVGIKLAFVARDEQDTGERMLLNFGHTVGHALEQVTAYARYSHGEAVAIGMVVAAALGERIGVTRTGTRARIEGLLQTHQLPTHTDLPVHGLVAAINRDKKKRGDHIQLVLLKEAGQAFLYPVHADQLAVWLEEVWFNG